MIQNALRSARNISGFKGNLASLGYVLTGMLRDIALHSTGFQTQPDAVIDIIRHSGHMDQIRARLVTLFAAPQKPTAILISHAKDTLAVLTYLLGCKIRVPQDVSLISVQPDNVSERVFPSPAFYEYDPVKYARLICRLIGNPPSTIQPIRIIPSFYHGDTLARPGR